MTSNTVYDRLSHMFKAKVVKRFQWTKHNHCKHVLERVSLWEERTKKRERETWGGKERVRETKR